MSIYKIGKCDYCGSKEEIVRSTPFMADRLANMCEYCWNETQKEYKASNGEYIVDFKSNEEEYKEISASNKHRFQVKNVQQLIDYLEEVKSQSGEDTEIRVDGQAIREFDDYIFVDHVEDYIDFVTPSYKSM